MPMTLQTYAPRQVDELALRLLDLAASVRQMASRSRENGIAEFALHDKKALEWCAKLKHWAHKTRSDLEVRILQDKAERRGRTAAE